LGEVSNEFCSLQVSRFIRVAILSPTWVFGPKRFAQFFFHSANAKAFFSFVWMAYSSASCRVQEAVQTSFDSEQLHSESKIKANVIPVNELAAHGEHLPGPRLSS